MSRQIYAVCLKCLFFLVLLVSIGLPALCQSSSSAAVTGIVQDTTDARIPNASVKLINTDTGTESNSTTSKDGNFSIPSVLPGHYRLQIEREGFDTTQLTGITLNVGDNKNVIIRMKVGSSQQTVTVDGSGLTINTTDGSVSTVIDRNFIANIPLNGRSFQDLIDLTPGIVTQSPQSYSAIGSSGDFSVNGQRTESNSYLIDGLSANTNAGTGNGSGSASTSGNLGASTALGTTQSLLSVDALQEFRVESSTYSAEYGGSPGGQFSFVTRSGTNSFHGSLFDYFRNNFFDANDWFNDHYDLAQPALRQNDFGGTLGGPMWIPKLYNGKDKTFFFLSYEGLRLDQPTEASLQYIPSNSLRAAAPSVLQPVLNAFPLPTGPEIQIACDNVTFLCPTGQPVGTSVPSGLSPFIAAYSLPSRIDTTSLRIDRSISPRNHAFLRAGYTPSAVTMRYLSLSGPFASNLQTYNGGIDSQLSSTFNNEFRLGYTRGVSKYIEVVDSFGGNTPINLSEAFGLGAYPRASPSIELSFNGVGSNYNFIGQNSANYTNQWNATDVLAMALGRHLVKAGFSYRRITSPIAPSDPSITYSYQTPSSIIANGANSDGDLYINRQLAPLPVFSQFAVFAQDEWRATPTLSLSIGLRWEIEPPPTSNNGVNIYPLRGNPQDPSTLSVGAPGTQIYSTTWNNFAPRLGVAWKAHSSPGAETVVRGGIGIFYDTGTSGASGMFGSIGTSAYSSFNNAPFPVTQVQTDSVSPVVGAPPYGDIFAMSPQFKLPYTIQWNGALEQAFGQHQTFTLSYVASEGRRLVQENEINLGLINPDFTYAQIYQNGLTSNYQSLQLEFQRQMSHGLQALASYTWSHSLDYGSSNANLAYIRGNSDFDLRNNFNAALSWEIPMRSDSIVLGALFANWALDGRLTERTAFPVTLTGNYYVDPGTGREVTSGLDLVPSVAPYIYSRLFPGGRAINASAFAAAPLDTLGNAPRNFVRGFGEQQLNLAVHRDFPLFEGLHMQFRAETFNVLNHPNFGYVDPNLGDATFGQATNTLAQALGTVSPVYQQGGARSMQFALKVQF